MDFIGMARPIPRSRRTTADKICPAQPPTNTHSRRVSLTSPFGSLTHRGRTWSYDSEGTGTGICSVPGAFSPARTTCSRAQQRDTNLQDGAVVDIETTIGSRNLVMGRHRGMLIGMHRSAQVNDNALGDGTPHSVRGDYPPSPYAQTVPEFNGSVRRQLSLDSDDEDPDSMEEESELLVPPMSPSLEKRPISGPSLADLKQATLIGIKRPLSGPLMAEMAELAPAFKRMSPTPILDFQSPTPFLFDSENVTIGGGQSGQYPPELFSPPTVHKTPIFS